MIVSASYKTDIPAFYGEWFARRLEAGYCRMRNPYSGRAVAVSLRRDDVAGFVFWTKNLAPFLPRLDEVARRGFPFVVQYTINGYPRVLEGAVTDPARAAAHMRLLRERYGPHAAVWRYDPILFTALTSDGFHLDNFARLAREIEGTTDEVVVSFAQIYRKTERNLNAAGVGWEDPPGERKLALGETLARIAAGHGMRMTMCSQRRYAARGIGEAACIDARRLSLVAGLAIGAVRGGNRPDCACHASRDIGDYDTCPHGCVYCYAVRNRAAAQRRFRLHNPAGEFLFEHPAGALP